MVCAREKRYRHRHTPDQQPTGSAQIIGTWLVSTQSIYARDQRYSARSGSTQHHTDRWYRVGGRSVDLCQRPTTQPPARARSAAHRSLVPGRWIQCQAATTQPPEHARSAAHSSAQIVGTWLVVHSVDLCHTNALPTSKKASA